MSSDLNLRTSIRVTLLAAALAWALHEAMVGLDTEGGYLDAPVVPVTVHSHANFDALDRPRLIRPVNFAAFPVRPNRIPESSRDPGVLHRVWSSSQLHVERHGAMVFGRVGDRAVQRQLSVLLGEQKVPVVVLLHGCKQPRWWGPFRFWREVAQSGFALIALDGFARRDWRALCSQRNLNRPLWDAEIRFALEQARTLPWVDGDNLFLIGFDEGGEAAGAYFGSAFNGVVVIAAGCRSYSIDAVSPLLVVASSRDAALQGRSRGCLNASDRFYIDSAVHQVLVYRDAQQAIRRFLLRHLV